MGAAGSSCHVHSSLWDRRTGKGLFAVRGSPAGHAALPAVAGGADGDGADFALLYAPTVNSYKRYQAGSFAPTRIAAGWDTAPAASASAGRAAGFRVENRIPGADAKSVSGLRRHHRGGSARDREELPPPRAYEGNAYEDAKLSQVPKTFREALDTLERSKVAREAFGARVVEHYLRWAARAAGLRPGCDQLGANRYFERI